jgi:hypothetical protein
VILQNIFPGLVFKVPVKKILKISGVRRREKKNSLILIELAIFRYIILGSI